MQGKSGIEGKSGVEGRGRGGQEQRRDAGEVRRRGERQGTSGVEGKGKGSQE